MIRALARLRRAMHMHFLRSRQAQLHQGIRTLVDCIQHDQLLIADMRRELLLIDARIDTASQSHAAALPKGGV